MDPESSFLHSQPPATRPYPESDQSNPCVPIQPIEDPFLYYRPVYAWVFQVISSPQGSPPKPCMHLSTTWPVRLILLDLIA